MRVRPEHRNRWVLAFSDIDRASALAKDLPETLDATIVSDGSAAFLAVEKLLPDVLIAEATLASLDGAGIMQMLSASPIAVMPHALIVVPQGMESFETHLLKLGACRVLKTPVCAADLIEAVRGLTQMNRLPRKDVTRQSILRSLWALGFSARLSGTAYLAMAIDLVSRDARLNQQLTTVLYPIIADAHHSTVSRVEHAMRRAIESAWSGGDLDMQYKVFGNTIDEKRAKPMAREMIARMAATHRTGMEID